MFAVSDKNQRLSTIPAMRSAPGLLQRTPATPRRSTPIASPLGTDLGQAGAVCPTQFAGCAGGARVLPNHDFSRMRVFPSATAQVHVDGMDDETTTDTSSGDSAQPQQSGGIPTPVPAQTQTPPTSPTPVTPTPTPATTPCPTSVSVGAIAQQNHSNQSAADKETWRTNLGAMSRMDVGPGPDHTGHCMKERLTTVSNTCPAAVYSRGGSSASSPCTGNRCLDINRYGTMWGLRDGPTAFLDMHRTRTHDSLLEGTGVSSCSVVCEQTYTCDRTQATTGTFRITRNFQAGTYVRPSDGTSLHITTGTVTKT